MGIVGIPRIGGRLTLKWALLYPSNLCEKEKKKNVRKLDTPLEIDLRGS